MASGYRAFGFDFDDLFDPYVQGTKPAATGRRVAGVDLNQRYAPIAFGSKRSSVGYRVGGVDVSNLWAAKGTASYSIAGLHGKSLHAAEQGLTNQGVVFASVGVSLAANGTWQAVGSTSRGAVDQPAPASGIWLPAGQAAADYEVQFVATSSGHADRVLTNGAAAYSALTSGRSVSLALPEISSANEIYRNAAASVTIRLRRKSTGAVSSTSVGMSVVTAGWA